MAGIGIGLLGCGVVGTAVALRLHEIGNGPVAVAVRDPERDRGLSGASPDVSRDPIEVVERPDVDVVVEVMGAGEASLFAIERALALGKPVVTADKRVIAEHGPELTALAEAKGALLLYEAAVGGGIPVLRAVEALRPSGIVAIEGVLNGTTNFILDAAYKGASLDDALSDAVRLGFAEADSNRDVNGLDAADKLAILARKALGADIRTRDVSTRGIDWLTDADVERGRREGCCWRLVATAAQGGTARVEPVLVAHDHPFARLAGADNAVVVRMGSGVSFTFAGPGAGGESTAVAVLADITAATAHLCVAAVAA